MKSRGRERTWKPKPEKGERLSNPPLHDEERRNISIKKRSEGKQRREKGNGENYKKRKVNREGT